MKTARTLEESYGKFTPAQLREMMKQYGFENFNQLAHQSGVQRGHLAEHAKGQRALGFISRRRLAQVFFKKADQEILMG